MLMVNQLAGFGAYQSGAVLGRITGATPSVPNFGIAVGSAANINDDTIGTTLEVTGGNWTALTVAQRVVCQLDLGSDQPVTKIEGKGLLAPGGSTTAGTPGFYYSLSATPTTWVQAGSTVTWPDPASNFNTGVISVTARYVSLVISAQNWTGVNITVADLNARND